MGRRGAEGSCGASGGGGGARARRAIRRQGRWGSQWNLSLSLQFISPPSDSPDSTWYSVVYFPFPFSSKNCSPLVENAVDDSVPAVYENDPLASNATFPSLGSESEFQNGRKGPPGVVRPWRLASERRRLPVEL